MKRILPFLLCFFITARLVAQAPTVTTNVGIPTGNTSKGIAYGNNVYVSILPTGVIYTSADGLAWAKVNDPGIPAGTLQSITYGSGSFVAVGAGGTIISSSNGQSWTTRTSGTANNLNEVQFLQNKFYTVGRNATLRSSTDGIAWSTVTIGVGSATDEFTNMAYGGGFFAIGARGNSPNGAYIYRSATGASNSWAYQNISSASLNKLQFIKDKFFIFMSSSEVYTSSNASTWTNSTSGMIVTLPNATTTNIGSPNQTFNGIYDGSKIYLFGSSQFHGGYGAIYSSTDGVNYKLEPKTAYIVCQGSAYLNGKYFQYGNEGLVTSTDGLHYKYPGGNYYGMATNGTTYVGVGTVSQTGIVFSSPDFATWTDRSMAGQKELSAVVYTGTKYVATGNQSVVESADGNVWSQISTPGDNFSALAFGANRLVAGGYNSTTSVSRIAYSANGTSWTTANTGNNSYFKIKYVNGNFFALGYDNATFLAVIFQSTDGITWANVTPSLPYPVYYFNDVVYDGSKYHFMGMEFLNAAAFTLKDFFSVSTSTVANRNSYGNKGTISSAHAGTVLGGTFGEGAFAYSNGHFVGSVNDIASNKNYVLYSSDGISWTAVSTNETTAILGIAASGNNFKLLGTGDGKITVNFASALPISLTTISASPANGKSLIKWETTSEQNTRDFVVEHSTNGTLWLPVATMNAAHNSNTLQSYQYIHATAARGINYYRLQQRDVDGRTSYSKTMSVLLTGTKAKLNVYPNPVVNGRLNVQLELAATLKLYNSNGMLALSKQLPAGSQQVNVKALAKGIYRLQANGENVTIVIQ
jgi:hypothetical protein